MKGIVFTEFLDLVEDNFGYDAVDAIIAQSNLPSKGVYTSIGTYSHTEMQQLVKRLSERTLIPVSNLYRIYGQHFFGVVARQYGHFLKAVPDAFSLFVSIELYIHVEVRKLYPDAELPRFKTKRIDSNTLEMIYSSERSMSDFTIGLAESCLKFYNEKAIVEKKILKRDGTKVQILIKKIGV